MVVSESMSSKACFCQMYINHTWNLSVKLRAFKKKKKCWASNSTVTTLSESPFLKGRFCGGIRVWSDQVPQFATCHKLEPVPAQPRVPYTLPTCSTALACCTLWDPNYISMGEHKMLTPPQISRPHILVCFWDKDWLCQCQWPLFMCIKPTDNLEINCAQQYHKSVSRIYFQ